MQKILKSVLKRIKPSKKEENEIKKLAVYVLETSRKIGKEFGFIPMLCGSVAKGTWLKPVELDLFLLFPSNLSREKLEEIGLKAAKKICSMLNAKWEKKYTEHPYLRCFLNNVEMDIVPCYDISPERIKSAVDRTPWHVRYVQTHLKKDQKDEVRLLKKFCKAQKVYGADLVNQGFSGYLCELLIIKFGSFENLVRKASEWYPQVVIWLEKKPKNLERFKNQPLIFIDPVDSKRNVAAALSFESFFKFVKACREFLKNPSEKFFFPKEKKLEVEKLEKILKKRDSKFYVLLFPRPNVHEDVLVSQLRRFAKLLNKYLEKNSFSLHCVEPFLTKNFCGIVIESEIWKLPKIMKRKGPEITSKHAKEFLKHYASKRAWIEHGYWVIEDERKFQSIEQFFKDFFKGSKKILEEKGIPSHIAKQKKRMKILIGDSELVKFASRDEEFKKWLFEYFRKNLNIYG